MISFISKKNIEDIIKDGVIITTGDTGMFFELEAAGVKLPSLDAMFIVKLTSGIISGVFYAVYKKWINEWYNNKNFMAPKKGNKTAWQENVVTLAFGFAPRGMIQALSWWPFLTYQVIPFWSRCFIFQWLKSRWDQRHSGGPLHLLDWTRSM